MNLVIRNLHADEMPLALDWAAQEGWNPGLTDALPFHAADPEGFLVGHMDDQPVALVSAVRYGATFGFVGFYIVHPDWRGQGHGRAIWLHAMQRLSGRNIALDGVLTQQDNYRRSGFVLAWRNIRYAGTTQGGSLVHPTDCELCNLLTQPFEELQDYDRAFFPADRSAFLAQWISQPGSHAYALRRNERLVAYGVIRPCRNGYKIGPLFADAADYARLLLDILQACVSPGQPVFLDVPEPNQAAVLIAEGYGMTPVFETARMYTGPVPDVALRRTFGITSFELG